MASEKGAVQLMNMLDKAVDEISKIDTRLGLYEKKLSVREKRNSSVFHRSISLVERRWCSENHESKRFVDSNRNGECEETDRCVGGSAGNVFSRLSKATNIPSRLKKGIQDFSDDYIRLLENADLTNDQERSMCIQAATLLTQALSVQLQPGERRFFSNEDENRSTRIF